MPKDIHRGSVKCRAEYISDKSANLLLTPEQRQGLMNILGLIGCNDSKAVTKITTFGDGRLMISTRQPSRA